MKSPILRTVFIFSLFLLLSGLFFLTPIKEYEDLPWGERTNLSGSKGTIKSETVEPPKAIKAGDIEPQKPLSQPPEVIKGVYVTSWTAGTAKKMDDLVGLIKKEKLNTVVIDIKDYSGYVAYDTDVEEVAFYRSKKIIIPKINSLIKKLHDENIYVISRMAVFQDPVVAIAKPEWAVKNSATGKVWKDNKGLAWIDPASKGYWDYTVKIAKEASSLGFDEINFDYIRFPTDGKLSNMVFPYYDAKTSLKTDTIRDFFVYLRKNLKDIKLSADLFGLVTIRKDDFGVGQIIEDAYQNFDYIDPMVYPSHYASGTLGYKNPALYPYEIVKYSIENAKKRLDEYNNNASLGGSEKTSSQTKIRPWLQAFDMGGKYDLSRVEAQIKASNESGGVGWLLWNPSNNYSRISGIGD